MSLSFFSTHFRRLVRLDIGSNSIPVGILLGLILLTGCGRLPNYSRPRIETGEVSRVSQGISYRTLAITDFFAPSLPKDLQSYDLELNAHTSVAIQTRPGVELVFVVSEKEGRRMVCGKIENLVFEALMLPEKSWWSPTMAKDQEAYVLQHEQIHFALMEIAARRLNCKAALEKELLQVCETETEAVKAKLSAAIDRWMVDAQEETLRQNGEFDEATSRLYAPGIQQGWHTLVLQELQKLAAWQ